MYVWQEKREALNLKSNLWFSVRTSGQISYCLSFSYIQTVKSERTELIVTNFTSSETWLVYEHVQNGYSYTNW